MLTAAEDDDTEDEMVTVVATGSGITGSQQVHISVTDTTDPPLPPAKTVKVKAKSPADVQAIFDREVPSDWAEGDDPSTFNIGQLFEQFGPDVDAVFAVTSSNDAVVMVAAVTGHEVTLSPMSEGEATITVTATDRASGDSDTASGNVMVADLPLEVGVSAPAMVAEGGSVMITVTRTRWSTRTSW